MRRNQDLTEDLKKDVLRILQDQKDFLAWLKERATELRLMLSIYVEDKENLLKTQAKLEFIIEILAVMNNKGDERRELQRNENGTESRVPGTKGKD